MASSGARAVHLDRPSTLDPKMPRPAAYATSTAATVTGTRRPGARRAPGRAPRAAAPRRAGSSAARNAPAPCGGPGWWPARRSSAPRCSWTATRSAHNARPGRPAPAAAIPCGAGSPSPSSRWCTPAPGLHAKRRPSRGPAPLPQPIHDHGFQLTETSHLHSRTWLRQTACPSLPTTTHRTVLRFRSRLLIRASHPLVASGPGNPRPERLPVNVAHLLFVLVDMAANTDALQDGLGGDPDAVIRELYSGYAKALHGYVEQFCPDRTSADDIVQEVFIRAWRHLPQLSADDRPIRPWLFRVARNLLIDANRAAQARPMTVPDQAAA